MNVRCIAQEILDHVQSSHHWPTDSRGFKSDDDFAAFYTARYLIEDCELAIDEQMEDGISGSYGLAYVQVFGLLQSVFVQQDSITALRFVVGCSENAGKVQGFGGAWKEIRDLRNRITGHPICQGNSSLKRRSFLSRSELPRALKKLKYQTYSNPTGDFSNVSRAISYHEVDLSDLISRYRRQSTCILYCTLREIRKQW